MSRPFSRFGASRAGMHGKGAASSYAFLGFDIAADGSLRDVRMIASEPAEQFGEQAARTIRRALKPAGATGYTGCAQRVRFLAPPAEGEPAAMSTD